MQAALVKQASDRCIIDPAVTSHEQKTANVFRQIHVSKMTPQISIVMNCEGIKRWILAKR